MFLKCTREESLVEVLAVLDGERDAAVLVVVVDHLDELGEVPAVGLAHAHSKRVEVLVELGAREENKKKNGGKEEMRKKGKKRAEGRTRSETSKVLPCGVSDGLFAVGTRVLGDSGRQSHRETKVQVL